MNEVYTIRSEEGDEYKLQFSTERSGVIASDILTYLCTVKMKVLTIRVTFPRGSKTGSTLLHFRRAA